MKTAHIPSLHRRQDVVIQPVSYVGDPTGLEVGLHGNPLIEECRRLFHPPARRGGDEGDREAKLVQGSLSLDRLVARYSDPVARSREPGRHARASGWKSRASMGRESGGWAVAGRPHTLR